MPDTGGDYGRGDGDARVNRAPPPAQGMTASKDEVEEVLPPKEVMDTLRRDVVGHCARHALDWVLPNQGRCQGKHLRANGRQRCVPGRNEG